MAASLISTHGLWAWVTSPLSFTTAALWSVQRWNGQTNSIHTEERRKYTVGVWQSNTSQSDGRKLASCEGFLILYLNKHLNKCGIAFKRKTISPVCYYLSEARIVLPFNIVPVMNAEPGAVSQCGASIATAISSHLFEAFVAAVSHPCLVSVEEEGMLKEGTEIHKMAHPQI